MPSEVHGSGRTLTGGLHVDRGRRVVMVVRRLADRDEPAFADEGVDLGTDELFSLTVDVHGMGDEEHVGAVVVELGPLMFPEDVFDGELMEPEAGRNRLELGSVRVGDVDPHDHS